MIANFKFMADMAALAEASYADLNEALVGNIVAIQYKTGFKGLISKVSIDGSATPANEARSYSGAYLSLIYPTPFALKSIDVAPNILLQTASLKNIEFALLWKQDNDLTSEQLANGQYYYSDILLNKWTKLLSHNNPDLLGSGRFDAIFASVDDDRDRHKNDTGPDFNVLFDLHNFGGSTANGDYGHFLSDGGDKDNYHLIRCSVLRWNGVSHRPGITTGFSTKLFKRKCKDLVSCYQTGQVDYTIHSDAGNTDLGVSLCC